MKDADTVFDIAKIKSILPHRYPFLLVDKIIEFERRMAVNFLPKVVPVALTDVKQYEKIITLFSAELDECPSCRAVNL